MAGRAAAATHTDFAWECSVATHASRSDNASRVHDMGDFIPSTTRQQDERLTFMPESAMAAQVYIQATDRLTGEAVLVGNTTLVTTNSSAGAESTASVLVIGDSLTAGGENTHVLQQIAANDSLGLRLIGSRGQSPTNRHEGRGGWTVHDYATAGREGVFFAVHGIRTPPGGSPLASAPEEPYTVEGQESGTWMIWSVNLTYSRFSLTWSGVVGASCYPCPPSGTALPPTGVLVHAAGHTTATGDEVGRTTL